MEEEDLNKIHKMSFKNKDHIEDDSTLGCFGCCKIFEGSDIEDWTDEGLTPICPYCGIDSVIYETEDVTINEELLDQMEHRWFGPGAYDKENELEMEEEF